MESKSIASYLFVRLLPVDVAIAVMATISWLVYIDVRDVAGTVALCAAMLVVHVLVWASVLWIGAIPLQTWISKTTACSDAELLAADNATDRLPLNFATGYACSWLVYFIGIGLLAWTWFPERLVLGQVELSAMGFQVAAIALGPAPMVFPLANLMLTEHRTRLARELGQRGLGHSRSSSSMSRRLTVLAVALVLVPTSWLAGMSWLSRGDAARELTRARMLDEVRSSAHLLNAGQTPTAAYEVVAFERLSPALHEAIATNPAQGEHAVLDPRTEHVEAAAPMDDGRWLVMREGVDFEAPGYWSGLITASLALLFWALFSIAGTTRALFDPVKRLHAALRRVTETGDLRALGRIPVLGRDEIGAVTVEFNRMLDVFEQLADAAQAVAAGDLDVRIQGQGDLQDAFRTMVGGLASLVAEIRDAAVAVASTSAEIHATAMSQEQAAIQQALGVETLSVGLQRLADSSGSIADSAGDVLTNAQQTQTCSDEVVAKLSALGAHVARIGELLDLIREIAGRSDLLALNGSLEATRAGEAGRGFALVAAEMRRLAERVDATVKDVSATIADIGAAKLATTSATETTRELAESTAIAARLIVDVTHSQDDETRQMSANARSIVEVVTSSSAASTQIRAAADNLRAEANRLERLIEQFELHAGAGTEPPR